MAKVKIAVQKLYDEELARREKNVVRVTAGVAIQHGLKTKSAVDTVVNSMVKSEKANVVKEAVLGLKKLKGMSAQQFNGGV